MRNKIHLLGPALLLFIVANNSDGTRVSGTPIQTTAACAVTAPNGITAAGEADSNSYGNRQVSVGPFGLWPSGTVMFEPGGPGFITPEGALGMKFGWQRGVPGQLGIEGRRLDGPAPPLRAEVSSGYGDLGFQASYVIFPTTGCWEVTGRVGDGSVTFVTLVVKIGDGPDWRRDSPS